LNKDFKKKKAQVIQLCSSKSCPVIHIMHNNHAAPPQTDQIHQAGPKKKKTNILLTFLELPGVCALSAAFKASKPPSSCPISITEENPISEQNERSRST